MSDATEERLFLERSLADLDREHAAGDLDDRDHARLGRHYRRRLQQLEADATAGAPGAPRRRSLAWIAGAVAVATLAGVLLARAAGQRLPGDTLVKDDATGSRQLLAEARAALGTNRAAALDDYSKVLAIDPNNAEAIAYSAWIDRLDTKAAVDGGTLAAADARPRFAAADDKLTLAAEKDPKLADPHCFQAILRFRDLAAAATARTAYERCLGLDPSQQVQALVAKIGPEIDTALAASGDPVVANLAAARLARDTRPTDALKRYDDVLKADPNNAEARTWQAWIAAKAAVELNRQGTLDDATASAVLRKQVTRLEQVRSDTPTAGDAACMLVILHETLDDQVDPAPALADCRSRTATPELRSLAVQAAAPAPSAASAATTAP